MNTAASHKACEIIIAPNRSGKNRYKAPHTIPATKAAIVSMKLNEPMCTSAYIAVVTMKPILGVQRLDSVCCTYPRQNISSAGPIRKSMSIVSSNGDSPVFIPYMSSTCGRAKLNSSWESLSPTQKTLHSTTAIPIPKSIFLKSKLTLFHHPGLKMVDSIERVHAEPVITHQKFIWGAVTGKNIMLHNMAASIMVNVRFFIVVWQIE